MLKLALGTVQFGLPYGIANQSGQVSIVEAGAMLKLAAQSGIDTLDTAIAYGESEARLGEAGCSEWKIVSKLPEMPKENIDIEGWVETAVESSLERLKVRRLYGLLLHRSQDLDGPKGDILIRALETLKAKGVVEKTGISIYEPGELDDLWPRYKPDLVQAPFNLLDRRLETSGWLTKLQQNFVEVHIRSIFLQGLLLMEKQDRPASFGRWKPLWDEWHRWLEEQSVTPLQACLKFALSQPEISRVVIGVDSLKQLQEILDNVQNSIKIPPATLACNDVNLINPSLWNLH